MGRLGAMSERHWPELLRQIPSAEFEKLAILRVLECSNGMIQLRFREGTPTRSMWTTRAGPCNFPCAASKPWKFPWEMRSFALTAPHRTFSKKSERSNVDGIKRNHSGSRSEFFRASRANLEAIGHERLKRAHRRLFADCYDLPVHTLDWGMDYINDFLTPARQTRAETAQGKSTTEHSKG